MALGEDYTVSAACRQGNDAIYMGANIFQEGRGPFGGFTFKEARVWAFDKQAMYNGQATTTVDLQAFTGVSAGLPVDVPQLNGQTVQANDFRPQDFEFRDGFAWSVQTIACNPGGGTVNCIRWNKVDPTTATIIDAGVYASDGE